MENSKPLVIYHGGCRDGWAAASIAHRRFGLDGFYWPGYYGQPPPLELAKGAQVYVLDFSYPRDQMKDLIMASRRTVVLDHHKTAEAALAGILDELVSALAREDGNDTIVFDMLRSGAGITWDFFNPNKVRPWWVNYVEDRDLGHVFTGTSTLPESAVVNAYLGAVPFSWREWAALDDMFLADVVSLGKAIQMKVEQYCSEVAKNAITFDLRAGAGLVLNDVPLVNAPQCDVSELLDYILDTKQVPVAMAWWQRADKTFQYSLRSRNVDVSEIAKHYGGGGHKAAAGFQVPRPIHTEGAT